MSMSFEQVVSAFLNTLHKLVTPKERDELLTSLSTLIEQEIEKLGADYSEQMDIWFATIAMPVDDRLNIDEQLQRNEHQRENMIDLRQRLAKDEKILNILDAMMWICKF